MTLTFNLTAVELLELLVGKDQIRGRLETLIAQGEQMRQSVEDLKREVQETKDATTNLQTAVGEVANRVTAKLADLSTTIQSLKDQLAAGGEPTDAELQALATELDNSQKAISADVDALNSIAAAAPPPPPPPPPEGEGELPPPPPPAPPVPPATGEEDNS